MIIINRDWSNINGEGIQTKYLEKVYPDSTSIPDEYEGRIYKPGKIHHFYGENVLNINLSTSWKIGDEILKNAKTILSVQEFYESKKLEEKCYSELRRLEYPSHDELVVALWEYQVEGKRDKIDEIQNLRLQIKNKYPKTGIGENFDHRS